VRIPKLPWKHGFICYPRKIRAHRLRLEQIKKQENICHSDQKDFDVTLSGAVRCGTFKLSFVNFVEKVNQKVVDDSVTGHLRQHSVDSCVPLFGIRSLLLQNIPVLVVHGPWNSSYVLTFQEVTAHFVKQLKSGLACRPEMFKLFQSRNFWRLSLILAPNPTSKSNTKTQHVTWHYSTFQQYAASMLAPPCKPFTSPRGTRPPFKKPLQVVDDPVVVYSTGVFTVIAI